MHNCESVSLWELLFVELENQVIPKSLQFTLVWMWRYFLKSSEIVSVSYIPSSFTAFWQRWQKTKPIKGSNYIKFLSKYTIISKNRLFVFYRKTKHPSYLSRSFRWILLLKFSGKIRDFYDIFCWSLPSFS